MKIRAIQLVRAVETIGIVTSRTGISHEVIQNALAQCQRYGPESLRQHRHDLTIDENLVCLRHMEEIIVICMV